MRASLFILRLASILLCLVLGPTLAFAQNRWDKSGFPGEAGKSVIGCAEAHSDESWLCLAVRCETAGTFGLYLEIAGQDLHDSLEISIDGQPFGVRIVPGSNAPYSNKLEGSTEEIIAALRTGSKAVVGHPTITINPEYQVVPLRGSGKAIRGLEAACKSAGATAEAQTSPDIILRDGQIVEVRNLRKKDACAYALTTGKVGSVEMSADGSDIEGFLFYDEDGENAISLGRITDRPDAAQLKNGLRQLLRDGNTLEIGIHGCGAAARVIRLVSAKLVVAAGTIESPESETREEPPTAAPASQIQVAQDLPDNAVDPASLNARGVALNRAGDEVGGFVLIKRAAEAGDARAFANMGTLLREGIGTPRDIKGAHAALQKAAQAGDPFGVLGWGLIHQDGIGVPQNSRKAYAIWEPMFGSIADPELKFWAAQWTGFQTEGMSPEETMTTSFRLLEDAITRGHRPSLFYVNDYSRDSGNRKQTLDNIEKALAMQPWTTGTNIEKLYVKELFSDNDEKLKWLVGYSVPNLTEALDFDVAEHLKKLGYGRYFE